MGKLIHLIFVSAFVLGGLYITSATADPAMQDDAPLSSVQSTGQSAARVYIDPDTGKLGGPPAGRVSPGLPIALQNNLSRSDEGLEKRLLPNGTALVHLQGRFKNTSVVTMTPAGEAHITCNHSVEGVEHALTHGSGDMP